MEVTAQIGPELLGCFLSCSQGAAVAAAAGRLGILRGGTSLQEHFFFDLFKMNVVKRAMKGRKTNFDQAREEKEKVLSNFIFF